MNLWLLTFFYITASIVLALGVLTLSRRSSAPSRLYQQNDIAGFIITIVGTVYAVLLAFTVAIVWEQFEEARTIAEQEANSVANLYRLSYSMDPAFNQDVHARLSEYASRVISHEWPAMDQRTESPEAHTILNGLWNRYGEYQPRNDKELIWVDQSLGELRTLSDARRQRLLQARTGLPNLMWGVLFLGALIVLANACLFDVQNVIAHSILVALLAVTLASVMILISALDFPFSGGLKIYPEAFQTVLDHFEDFKR